MNRSEFCVLGSLSALVFVGAVVADDCFKNFNIPPCDNAGEPEYFADYDCFTPNDNSTCIQGKPSPTGLTEMGGVSSATCNYKLGELDSMGNCIPGPAAARSVPVQCQVAAGAACGGGGVE